MDVDEEKDEKELVSIHVVEVRELEKSCCGQKLQSSVDEPGVLIRVGKNPIKITPEITPENLELESSVQDRTKLG